MKMISILVILVALSACSKSEESSNSTSALPYDVPASQRGQWQYLDSDETVWLDEKTDLQYTTVDSNLLKTDTGNYVRYLVRSGAASISLTGHVNQLAGNTVTAKPGGTATMAQAPGYAGFEVIANNIQNNRQHQQTIPVSSDGSFTLNLPASSYEIQVADNNATTQNATTDIRISHTQEDAGEITVVNNNLHNFKVELLEPEYRYFGTLPGQDEITYSKKIRIKNIGDTDLPGLNYTITTTDTDVASLTASGDTLGLVRAGNYVDVTATIKFHRPATEKPVQLNVTMTDFSSRAWTDHVTLLLSNRPPVTINTYPDITGRIIVGNNYIAKFGQRLPHQPGSSMDIGIFNSRKTSDAGKYCIDINTDTCNSTAVNNSNILTSINEPDNTQTLAANISMHEQKIGYLHAEDSDFMRLTFTDGNKPFDAYAPGTVNIQDASISDLYVEGDYLYVTGAIGNNEAYFGILDISNPAQAVALGSLSLDNGNYTNSGTAIVIHGNYAYIATYISNTSGNLYTVDITDRNNPALITSATISLGNSPNAMIINDNHIFMALNNELRIFDISTPATPIATGQLATTSGNDILVSGNYVYMTGSKLNIVDVSDKTQPVEATSINTPNTIWRGLSLTSNVLLTIKSGNAYTYVTSIDITDPLHPIETQGMITTSTISKIESTGNVFYLGNSAESRLRAYSFTPAPSQFIGQLTTPANTRILRKFGNLLYVGYGYSVYSSGQYYRSGSVHIINPNQ